MVDSENARSLMKLNLNGFPRSMSNSLSPMTDLANNLGGLSTGISTPKRRISWSNFPTPDPIPSDESMSCLTPCDDKANSTPHKDSPLQENRLFKDVTSQNSFNTNRRKPSPFFLPSTPVTCFLSSTDKENIPEESSDFHSCNCTVCQQDPIDTTSSQDSGFCGSHTDKECSNSNKTRFNFEIPIPSRKFRSSSINDSSPKSENKSSVRCKRFSCNDFIEEDFLDGFTANDLNEETQFPSGISKLMESPLLSFSETTINTEEPLSSRLLHRKFSEPITHTGTLEEFIKGEDKLSFKRPDPPQQEVFQIHHKKRRKAISFSHNCQSLEEPQPVLQPKRSPILQRCHSETEATIIRALQRSSQDPDLIGDFSRPYALPLIAGKHQDLKSVTPHTVNQLLEGKFQDTVDSHVIVDCRYPYEYDAGHIKGAKNIYTKDGIIKEFLCNPLQHSDQNSRLIIIFHCEFSSERGPALTRFLRSKDREANKDCYPSLHYPEIYLLNGGYKAFYESYKVMCEPQDYKPMHHKDHEKDLRVFRSKSKSWNAESKRRLVVRPGLKF